MTTIIGVQYDDHCVLAADSVTTSGDRAYVSAMQPKIVESGEYLLACAGLSVATDVVMYTWKPPVARTDDIYRHMVGTVVPSIRHALSVSEVTFKEDDSLQILLAYNGVIFQIESDYSVLHREDGLYAIGSGAQYAVGAFAAGATIQEAIEIAADNDIYTGLPVEVRRQQRW